MHAFIRSVSVLAFVLAAALAATPVDAITRCSGKVSSKDGTIAISGSSVSGNVLWGVASGGESSAFANAATCIKNGRAKACALGAPGSAEAITPPPLCRVWLRDDTTECSVYLKGCTPGARTAGAPVLDPRFGSNTSLAGAGVAAECVLGSIWLAAGVRAGAVPADGRVIPIGSNTALFQLIGNSYGGDPAQGTFALPDLRAAAPNGVTYVICTQGIFPAPPP